MTETRARIREFVDAHPGVHFNELVRRLDLAPGQMQYHVKRLCSSGDLAVERLYGRTHYYPLEYDEWSRGALALLRRETAGDIVAVVLERGQIHPDAVAEDLDLARSTVEWHVDRLIERDVVAKRRDDQNRVRLTLTRPADTATVLREAYPSMPDRLVDRFTRLVDRLLEE